MSRVTNAPASRERRRRRLDDAKGFRGSRSKLFRQATEAVNRAQRLKFTPIEDATLGFWLMAMDLRHIDHGQAVG